MDGREYSLQDLKRPLYDIALSVISGVAGGAVIKYSESSSNFVGSKIQEYREMRDLHKEKEAQKVAEIISETLIGEMEKYMNRKEP